MDVALTVWHFGVMKADFYYCDKWSRDVATCRASSLCRTSSLCCTITSRDDATRLLQKQARSQRPPSRGAEEIQGGRNFWKQILTDHFIVTQWSCKRVCFFVKKRRDSIKSNAAVRLFSNVRWTRITCRAVVIDRRCGRSMTRAAMLSMTKTRHREAEGIS